MSLMHHIKCFKEKSSTQFMGIVILGIKEIYFQYREKS